MLLKVRKKLITVTVEEPGQQPETRSQRDGTNTQALMVFVQERHTPESTLTVTVQATGDDAYALLQMMQD